MVRKFLDYGRAADAVELVGAGLGVEPNVALDVEQMVEVLDAVEDLRHADQVMFAYNAARILDDLNSAQVEREAIARLEWKYLELLEYGGREPRVRLEELRGNRAVFADVVSLVYLQDDTDGGEEAISPDERAGLPGQTTFCVGGAAPQESRPGTAGRRGASSWVQAARTHLAERRRSGRVIR